MLPTNGHTPSDDSNERSSLGGIHPWSKLVPVSIWDSAAHEAILPLLVRAILGADPDCMEVVKMFATTQLAGCALEGHECTCCAAAGKWCFSPVKCTTVGVMVTYAIGRCINCVLAGMVCEMPARTFSPVCLCDWIMPAPDRQWTTAWVILGQAKAEWMGMPIELRTPIPNIGLLPHIKKWSYRKLSSSQVLPPNHDVTFKRAPTREPNPTPDGRWIVHPIEEWVPCVCAPGLCDPGSHVHPMRHFSASDNVFETSSEEEMSDIGYRDGDESRFSIVSSSEGEESAGRGGCHACVAVAPLTKVDVDAVTKGEKLDVKAEIGNRSAHGTVSKTDPASTGEEKL